MKIEAITFDFWQTLFQDAHAKPRMALRVDAFTKATKVSEAQASEVLARVGAEFLRIHIEEQRTLSPTIAVRMAAKALGCTLEEEVIESLGEIFGRAVLEYSPVPVEGALAAVRAAAVRGPVGLISDTGISPGSSLRILLERNGFLDYFETLSFSDEVGVAKPQRPIFEQTAQALNTPLDSIFHIGDLEPTDIQGIQEVGGTAGLFTGVNTRFKEVTKAQCVFESWADFITFLDGLN